MGEDNNNSHKWTWSEDKAFEIGLIQYPEGLEGRWEKIATLVPGRSPAEVEEHYQALVHDVNLIESGLMDHEFVASYSEGPDIKKKNKRRPLTTEEEDRNEVVFENNPAPSPNARIQELRMQLAQEIEQARERFEQKLQHTPNNRDSCS